MACVQSTCCWHPLWKLGLSTDGCWADLPRNRCTSLSRTAAESSPAREFPQDVARDWQARCTTPSGCVVGQAAIFLLGLVAVSRVRHRWPPLSCGSLLPAFRH